MHALWILKPTPPPPLPFGPNHESHVLPCLMPVPGFVQLTHDIDEQPPDSQEKQKPGSQAKISTLFRSGKDSGAPTSIPANRTAAQRGSSKLERAQQAQQADQAQQAQQSGEAGDVQQAASGRAPDRDLVATDKEPAATDMEADAPDAEAAAGATPCDNGSLANQRGWSARAARHLARRNALPLNALPSPSEPRAGKRRRASAPADVSHALNQVACVLRYALHCCP